MAYLVPKVNQEPRETMVKMVHPELLERMESLAKPVLYQDPKALMVNMVKMEL